MASKKRVENVFDQFHDYPVCEIPGRDEVDMMAAYRPSPKQMLDIKDYNLTQSYAVLDHNPVKVRIQDTECEYKHYPPGHVRLGQGDAHGMHGPLELLLNEEYQAVIDYYQAFAHEKLEWMKKQRLAADKELLTQSRGQYDKSLGPDWFQELSNQQRNAVDSLAKAIVADLKQYTIDRTQQVLAILGLVLRPNHVHVRQALSMCGSCPVEFLLVLYQIMNPKRDSYSINDRLLLSAVVHLTVRSTLRELHVRIPSPPRPPRPKPPRKKPPAKPELESPYQEKFSMYQIPEQKCYHAPNRYYATNEYFDYATQLICNTVWLSATRKRDAERDYRFEKTFTAGVCTCEACACLDCSAIKDLDEYTRIEVDLITEWTRAQKCYNALAESKYVRALFKPSVFMCPIGTFRFDESMIAATPVTVSSHGSSFISSSPATANQQRSRKGSRVSFKRTSKRSLKKDRTKASAPAGATPVATRDCVCLPQSKWHVTPTSSQAAVASKSTPPVTVSLNTEELGCMCSISDYGDLIPGEEEGELYRDDFPESIVRLPCTVRDYEVGPVLTVKTTESGPCNCKEAILRRIDESLCHCERCTDDRRRQNSYVQYVIDRMKATEEGESPLPVITECTAKPICTCMERYLRQWEQFERTRGVRKVQEALRSLDARFNIVGTAVGRDGKIVYILNSVQTTPTCQCAHIREMEAENRQILRQMPKPPDGCIQYEIAGVQSRPEGNVYILAGANSNPECNCMEVYDRFMQEHSLCLNLYHEYLKKIAFDTEEYLKELNPGYCDFSAAASWTDNDEVEVLPKECACHCDRGTQMCCCNCPCMSEISVECRCSVDSCPCGFDVCECITEEGSVNSSDSLYAGEEICVCTPPSNLSQQEGIPSDNCVCPPTEVKPNALAKPPARRPELSQKTLTDDELKSSKSSSTEEDPFLERIRQAYKEHPLYQDVNPADLERYVILKKLPGSERGQTALLKRVLRKLAEDGFPLARLPEVHRLPIFRLWWRFRLRKFYTATERWRLLKLVDQIQIEKLDKTRENPPNPDATFLQDTPSMQTFAYHRLIKANNLAERMRYIHSTRELSIQFTRKFFTLTRQYDFPTKTFRDVFFAYMPSKEEDTLVDQIWKENEYRRPRKKTKCL